MLAPLPMNREGANPTDNQHYGNFGHPKRNGLPPARRGIRGGKRA